MADTGRSQWADGPAFVRRIEDIEDVDDKPEDAMVGQLIEDADTGTAGADNPGMFENPQVAADDRGVAPESGS